MELFPINAAKMSQPYSGANKIKTEDCWLPTEGLELKTECLTADIHPTL